MCIVNNQKVNLESIYYHVYFQTDSATLAIWKFYQNTSLQQITIHLSQ